MQLLSSLDLMYESRNHEVEGGKTSFAITFNGLLKEHGLPVLTSLDPTRLEALVPKERHFHQQHKHSDTEC